MKNEIIPQYDVRKSEYTIQEKMLLGEMRENLVDIAISTGENFQVSEERLLSDIKNLLFLRLSGENQDTDISNAYLDHLSRRFLRDIIGYGKIDPLIQDDELEEIMIIGTSKPIFVYHRQYGMMKTNLQFESDEELRDLIDSIARQINRRIDQESPILDGRLVDGSRINATIPPVSADGPSLTIRKFKRDPLTIIDLINSRTVSLDLAGFLWLCIDGLGVKSANAIISGGTSSGKTTTLNALSAFINPNERIITIEDTLELQIPHEHVIRMETRPANVEGKGELTMNDLVKNSLRQRPDRIIVGEVRAGEAITLFTALNTGHSGFGTLHSNDARETITRLTNEP
ncbi:MAG: CpaF family protein, partial [Methanobrevibacter sp.]|nr:CpaF family protein [Methanobrevibacter sp.]